MSTPQEEHKEIEQKIIEIKDRYPERCNIEGLEPAFSHDLREAIAFGQSLKDDGENSQVFTVQEDDWKEMIDELVRDLTSVVHMSKSETHQRIETLLTSQAHALKEQMKACVPEKINKKTKLNIVNGFNPASPVDITYLAEHQLTDRFNDCREQTLSAIESIEI